MQVLVKILLILVILTTLGNLVCQVVLWTPPVSDKDTAIGGDNSGEENKPVISVNVSTAVIPDAEGKVPAGGVNIADDTASVVVPEGVQMAEGATKLTLTVDSISEPNEDVPVEKGETANSVDVHIDGVAEDNTVPMLVTLKTLFSKGLNSTSVKMYHVENGAPVEMTLVSQPANHNEFSYDPATGDIVMCVASFSEYVTVENNLNFWEGKAVTDWYNDTDTAFTLTNAEQLAGFGILVDGGNDFAGKTIKLGADIDLYGTDENGDALSFNPIGFKYPGATDENGNPISRIFRGTFDGQNHTIKNLYQNGWAMGLSYSNAGGGLFAGVENATIQNLTMKGADIVMEAVPMGTVASYAYGTCTFDNIRISNSTLQNYNWDIAAIVGGVNGKHTFSNIYIENSVTLSSLWGSFGGGIGGVIGSVYGGNNGKNSVEMKNVDVACVLDVYNDVTSAYQWYAYRFCGMLIGNTNEPGADGKNAYTAQASFLTCDNVKVYYGDWVNYHYCKFTNQSNESGSVNWQNNYPWVRVEEGLSNPGYSNARYGHPVVDGVAVTDANHTHKDGDDCNLLLTFDQLYGGDQGVYGQPEHEGVEIVNYAYTITYIDGNTLVGTEYVDSNAKAYNVTKNLGTENFGGWINLGATKITQIPAGNTNDVVLYSYYLDKYVARWLNESGDIIATQEFTNKTSAWQYNDRTLTAPSSADVLVFDHWEVRMSDGTSKPLTDIKPSQATEDVTFYPYYTVNSGEGSIGLTPVDSNGDGIIDYYTVEAAGGLSGEVVIPGEVNGVPVTVITDLSSDFVNGEITSVIIKDGVKEIGSNAFSMTSGLKTVTVPASVTSVGSNTFSSVLGTVANKQVTINYAGTWEQWQTICNTEDSTDTNWDSGLKNGSKVVCTDGTYELYDPELYGYDPNHEWSDWTKQ